MTCVEAECLMLIVVHALLSGTQHFGECPEDDATFAAMIVHNT